MIHSRAVRITLWVLFAFTGFLAFTGSLQGIMFPLLFGVYLTERPLVRFLSRIPLPAAFILAGTAAGLLIEAFAILDNAGLPDAEKVLLHPDPAIDLLIACFWYGGFMLTWYLLLRKIAFSKKAVYGLSALYGLFTEYGVRALIVGNPVTGTMLALIITAAYGIFPLIAYLLTEPRFGERARPHLRHYTYAVLSFFFFWAVVGNFVYNPLIALFPKGF